MQTLRQLGPALGLPTVEVYRLSQERSQEMSKSEIWITYAVVTFGNVMAWLVDHLIVFRGTGILDLGPLGWWSLPVTVVISSFFAARVIFVAWPKLKDYPREYRYFAAFFYGSIAEPFVSRAINGLLSDGLEAANAASIWFSR